MRTTGFFLFLFGNFPINVYFCSVMRKMCAMLCLLLSLCVSAQQYRPEGRSFVCVNGQNRFSRMLYGSDLRWCVATSDRPVFAVYSQHDSCQIQMRLQGVRLDEADYCESRYQDGMRSYVVRHKGWGAKAVVRLKVVAAPTSRQAFWRFRTEGFEGTLQLDVTILKGQQKVRQLQKSFEDEVFVSYDSTAADIALRADDRFDAAEEAVTRLASRLEFNTPDAYVNALGGVLSVAGNVNNKVKNVSIADDLWWHCRYDVDRAYLFRLWPQLKKQLSAVDTSSVFVTREAARHYRDLMLAAHIAKVIGEDGAPYQAKARAFLSALHGKLWLHDRRHWAERQDTAGLRRLHPSAALWSIYTPIDCGACTPEQAYWATKYVEAEIPHIPVAGTSLSTLSTTSWMPYSPGMNNVQPAQVMLMSLAYFQAGRSEEGYQLLRANLLDQLYGSLSPASFGAYSQYDAAQGATYEDDGACRTAAERVLTEGLFGIRPDGLQGRCIIRPGFPEAWDSASIRTPYVSYRYHRMGNEAVYEVTQHLRQPQKIVIRQNLGLGRYRDVEGTAKQHQVIRVKLPIPLPEVRLVDAHAVADETASWSDEPTFTDKFHKQNISRYLNASITDLPAALQIDDAVFRSLIDKDEFVMMGVPFRTTAEGANVAFCSLSSAYPDSLTIPLGGSASQAWLLLAGTTNSQESRIANGLVVAQYKDGTADTLQLVNPDNWCPIDQDYYIDGKAFQAAQPRPYRVSLATGRVSRNLGKALGIQGVAPRLIPGGAATMLRMPLNRHKRLLSLSLHALSNDVIVGLMAVTLQ